jgi:hypothetical protein
MPRRPVKNPKPNPGFKPGQSGNPNGRPAGSVNEINVQIKTAFAMLLANQLPNLEAWLEAAAKKDPIKAADLMLRVSERFLPSLQRTEITGTDGQAFQPITINLPNIPQINVATSISETAPEPTLELPESKDIPKLIGEGTPAFVLPKPQLSENQLRDLREMGMVPPDSLGEGTPAEG